MYLNSSMVESEVVFRPHTLYILTVGSNAGWTEWTTNNKNMNQIKPALLFAIMILLFSCDRQMKSKMERDSLK